MPDFEFLKKAWAVLSNDWRMLWAARKSVAFLLLIVGVAVWWATQSIDAIQIANYKSAISSLEAEATRLRGQVASQVPISPLPIPKTAETIPSQPCPHVHIGESDLSGGQVGYDIEGCGQLDIGTSKLRNVKKGLELHDGK